MADIMVDSVTTGIDLNETKAVEAINRLKSAVKDSTREWQINEAQAKIMNGKIFKLIVYVPKICKNFKTT